MKNIFVGVDLTIVQLIRANIPAMYKLIMNGRKFSHTIIDFEIVFVSELGFIKSKVVSITHFKK